MGMKISTLVVAAGVLVAGTVLLAGDRMVLSRDVSKELASLKEILGRRVVAEDFSAQEVDTFLGLVYLDRKRKKHKGVSLDDLDELHGTLGSLARHYLRKIRLVEPFAFYKPQKEEEGEKLFFKIFNVSDLIFRPPAYPAVSSGIGAPKLALRDWGGTRKVGTSLGKTSGGPVLALNDEDKYEARCGIGAEEFIELLHKILGDDDTGDELSLHKGLLMVRKPRRAIKKIEKILALLRAKIGFMVKLEVSYVRCTPAFYRAFFKGTGKKKAAHLTEEDEKKLVEALSAGKDAAMFFRGGITAYNGQRVYLRKGEQLSMVTDYELNVSGPIPILNPLSSVYNDGFVAEFRPVLSTDGKHVEIDVGSSYSEIKRPIAKTECEGGDLQLPEISISRLSTTVRVKTGRTILVGGVTSSKNGNDAERPLILLIKPTIIKPTAK